MAAILDIWVGLGGPSNFMYKYVSITESLLYEYKCYELFDSLEWIMSLVSTLSLTHLVQLFIETHREMI